MSKLIKIVDSGHSRYTLEPETTILGRQYDDDAETIVITKPQAEATSTCTMHIQNLDRQTLDHINITSGTAAIRNTISQYPSVLIGFSFTRTDGSIKDTEIKQFYFSSAMNPSEDIVSPQYEATIVDLVDKGFVNIVLKTGTQSTYQFKNLDGDVVKEITLTSSGYSSTYTHTQTEAASTWTINHNLEKYPSVTIVDSQGIVIVATIQYTNANTVVATFTEATSGKAYLN